MRSLRNTWKPSKERIGKYACIELRTVCMGLETVEYGLSGPGGDIWEVGGGRYAAIIIASPSRIYVDREEYMRFEEADLDKWVARLRIPLDPREQTPHANTFGMV